MNDRIYTIINSVDLTGVNFSQVMETSIDTVRKNNDESLAILKYEGTEPSSLVGISKVNIDSRDYHNHSEILQIISATGPSGWTNDTEI